MPDKIKIGILGGDKRQLVIANKLAEKYECAVWGINTESSADEDYLKSAVKCKDMESAIRCSSAVILPLPASFDGEHLNCSSGNSSAGEVRLWDICEKMPRASLIIGGKIPSKIKRYAAELGIEIFDYYDSEELQIRNSVPTAEGAISACIENLDVTVHGMKTAVFGYGRIGRTLAQRLVMLGAEVYAVARSINDRSWAVCDGCTPVTLDEFLMRPMVCDSYFNTIPFMVFDRETLSKIPKETVIFELATGCSGVDMEEAESLGIKVIPLMSLPGKTSPVTSGEIIYKLVYDRLTKYFEGRIHE